MTKVLSCALLTLASFALFVGCGSPANPTTTTPDPKTAAKEEKCAAALAKLSPDDRKLAEAQKFCALANESRLGGMGPPVKIEIEGQAVFLCCEGCKEGALETQETLAKVERLKQAGK